MRNNSPSGLGYRNHVGNIASWAQIGSAEAPESIATQPLRSPLVLWQWYRQHRPCPRRRNCHQVPRRASAL